MNESRKKDPSEPPSLVRRLRTWFVTGLVVIAPLALTIWIVVQLFLFADGFLGKPIQLFLGKILGIGFFKTQMIHGIGFIALLILILATGWFARQYLGNQAVRLVNAVIERIPLVNKVYIAILQISQAFLGGQRDVFKHAVIIEYPKKHVYSIGFVTQDTRGPAQEALEEDVISVFIPTTPNPTSGYLLFVPKEDVTFIDISVEEALKLIISAGAVIPRPGGGSVEAARRFGFRIRKSPGL